MIPRIAWFPWDHSSGEMSWLRQRSVETFSELNPSWRVVVPDVPADIAETPGLGTSHVADWTKWRLLSWHGGFVFDTDIVFLKPIPEEWLDAHVRAQLCAERKDIFQIPALGSVPGSEFVTQADNLCEQATKENTPVGYETFGVPLLRRVTNGRASERTKGYNISNIPSEAFCFYNWTDEVEDLWSDYGPRKLLSESAIGVHWYGGHWLSRQQDRTTGPDGVSWIERMAK